MREPLLTRQRSGDAFRRTASCSIWVAGYIFQHASGTVAAIPMATGQLGINGQLIHGADTRDYFTVLAR